MINLPILSFSKLNEYDNCPRSYYYNRIEKIPRPPAAWTARGTALHSALDDWEQSGREIDALQRYYDKYDEVIQEMTVQQPDLSKWEGTPFKKTEVDIKLRREDGAKQCQWYVADALSQVEVWSPHRLPSGQLAAELKFELEFPEFIIWGYIDLVKEMKDGSLYLSDLKSSSNDKKQSSRQLGLYRYALKEQYDLDISFGHYVYSKLGRASDWLDLRHYDRDFVHKQYLSLHNDLALGHYRPRPSKDNCGMCSYKSFCEEAA